MKNVTKIIELFGGFDNLAKNPISLRVDGFMPLSIERIGTGPRGGMLISVMHWYEQNGDLMRDPDVEIEILPNTGEWLPLSYRQDSAGLFQEAQIDIDGELMRASDRFVKDIQRFLKLWDQNIGEQGFIEAARKVLDNRGLAELDEDRSA
ncbi:MAG: hypothetical protein FJ297_05075 [Planctomycetes bacterium]|nr:hypothetical protein [Planctomycetota bacterium]